MFHQLCMNEQVYCEAATIEQNWYLMLEMNMKMDYKQGSDFEEEEGQEEEQKDKISMIEKDNYHIIDY